MWRRLITAEERKKLAQIGNLLFDESQYLVNSSKKIYADIFVLLYILLLKKSFYLFFSWFWSTFFGYKYHIVAGNRS